MVRALSSWKMVGFVFGFMVSVVVGGSSLQAGPFDTVDKKSAKDAAKKKADELSLGEEGSAEEGDEGSFLDPAKSKAVKAKDAAKQKADAAKQKANAAKDAAKNKANKAKEAAKAKADAAKQGAKSKADALKAKATGVKSAVKAKGDGLKGAAKAKAKASEESFDEALEDVSEE